MRGPRRLTPWRRGITLLSLTALLLAGGAPAASAHGIGPVADRSIPEFVWLGTTHMLLGWDHLLFIAGVLILAGSARRATGLISLFALGHSATLLIATFAGWRVNPVAVDVVVALSLVFVGVVGLLGAGSGRWLALAVACFGLIHGLVWRVLAFNVGVEFGQMLAISVLVTLVMAARTYSPELSRTRGVLRGTQAALVAIGVVAAATLVVIGNPPQTAKALGHCQVRDRTESFKGDSGHPHVQFTEPDRPAPESGFAHVIGDGFVIVIVRYKPQPATADLDALRTYVTDPLSGRVVGGPAPGQKEAFKAVNAYRTLSCTEFDLDALRTFTRDWWADPRSRPAE